MKVRTISDDVHGRYKSGEVGECLENTMPLKYQYLVDFGVVGKRNVTEEEQRKLDDACSAFGLGKIICSGEVRRVIFFYADEVEEIE